MKQKILNLQLKIEKKSQKFKYLSFEHYLYAVIGAAGVQALIQYLTVDYPEPWQDKQELTLLSDPAFYLGILLMCLVVLLILRKSKRIKR